MLSILKYLQKMLKRQRIQNRDKILIKLLNKIFIFLLLVGYS